jgi:hypothetical protein
MRALPIYYRWKDEVEAGAKAALGGEALRMPSRRNGSNNWSGRDGIDAAVSYHGADTRQVDPF